MPNTTAQNTKLITSSRNIILGDNCMMRDPRVVLTLMALYGVLAILLWAAGW